MECYKNIGTFTQCEHVCTGLIAPCDGWYKFNTYFNGAYHTSKKYFIRGEEFVLLNKFNENTNVILTIVQPNKTKFEYVEPVTGYKYTEFMFLIRPNYCL